MVTGQTMDRVLQSQQKLMLFWVVVPLPVPVLHRPLSLGQTGGLGSASNSHRAYLDKKLFMHYEEGEVVLSSSFQ